jgi:23S rRNA pseudouridine1911/1915/1917 synthase
VNSIIKLSSPATREYWEIPVLYHDEHLLGLDKPAGLPTVPEPGDPERPSLMQLLHQAIKEQKPWVRELGVSFLDNAYTLDPDTSGVILLVRSKGVQASLANEFGSEKPLREYVALVQGTPRETTFLIDASIAPHPIRAGLMKIDPHHGKRARTRVELEESFGRWSWVRCYPLTSRTHQVRVHLRRAGHPIVADRSYGGRPLFMSRFKPNYRLKPGHEERPLLARVALHAAKLSLMHPVTGSPVEITAPLPKDLQVALKYLRRFPKAGSRPEADSAEVG